MNNEKYEKSTSRTVGARGKEHAKKEWRAKAGPRGATSAQKSASEVAAPRSKAKKGPSGGKASPRPRKQGTRASVNKSLIEESKRNEEEKENGINDAAQDTIVAAREDVESAAAILAALVPEEEGKPKSMCLEEEDSWASDLFDSRFNWPVNEKMIKHNRQRYPIQVIMSTVITSIVLSFFCMLAIGFIDMVGLYNYWLYGGFIVPSMMIGCLMFRFCVRMKAVAVHSFSRIKRIHINGKKYRLNQKGAILGFNGETDVRNDVAARTALKHYNAVYMGCKHTQRVQYYMVVPFVGVIFKWRSKYQAKEDMICSLEMVRQICTPFNMAVDVADDICVGRMAKTRDSLGTVNINRKLVTAGHDVATNSFLVSLAVMRGMRQRVSKMDFLVTPDKLVVVEQLLSGTGNMRYHCPLIQNSDRARGLGNTGNMTKAVVGLLVFLWVLMS